LSRNRNGKDSQRGGGKSGVAPAKFSGAQNNSYYLSAQHYHQSGHRRRPKQDLPRGRHYVRVEFFFLISYKILCQSGESGYAVADSYYRQRNRLQIKRKIKHGNTARAEKRSKGGYKN